MSSPSDIERSLRGNELVSKRCGLLFVLICACALSSTWSGLPVGGLQIIDVLLVPTVVVALGYLIVDGRILPIPAWVVACVTAILLVAVLHVLDPVDTSYFTGRYVIVGYGDSVSGSSGAPNPLLRGLLWIAAAALLPLLVATAAARRPEGLRTAMAAWVVGVCISAFIGILDYLSLTNVSELLLGYSNASGRQSGLSSHPNNLGVSCAIALPIAMYFLQDKTRFRAYAMMGVLLGGVIVSGSRGSQVVFFLALITCLAVRRNLAGRTLTWLALIVITGGIAASTIPQLSLNFSEILRFGGSGSEAGDSDLGRYYLALQAARDFAYRPIDGIGYEVLTSAHSIYLQVVSAGGLLLAAGMLLYWGGLLRASYKYRKFLSGLPIFAGISVGIWLLVGIVENQLIERFLYFPVAVICAAQICSMLNVKSSRVATGLIRK